jgi:hypothetical protein
LARLAVLQLLLQQQQQHQLPTANQARYLLR